MDNHFLEDRVSQHVTSPSSASSVFRILYLNWRSKSKSPQTFAYSARLRVLLRLSPITFHEYRNNGKSPEGLEKPMWSLEDIAPRSPCQVPEVNPDPARACGGMSVRSDPPGADSIHERGTRERPGSFLTPVQSDTASGPDSKHWLKQCSSRRFGATFARECIPCKRSAFARTYCRI